MEATLTRRWLSEASTIGELRSGLLRCYTLEDRTRNGPKVWGETAIPLGRYQVIVTHSPRFGRRMPILLKVPGFEGIRIHPGNNAEDTQGCILLGRRRAPDQILDSRVAYDEFLRHLDQILLTEHYWLTIRQESA